MLFCSVAAVAVVGIIITMTAKVTNGVGTTAVTMPDARKSTNAASLRQRQTSNRHTSRGYGDFSKKKIFSSTFFLSANL